EHMAQGEPRLLGTSPSSESVSVNSVFEREDILFGKLRPNLRKCLSAPFAGYCSTDILVLRAREGVNARYASYVCQSDVVFDAAIRSAIGTKMPRTSWAALSTVSVFAPESETEQAMIADILDGALLAIQTLDAAIAKQQRIKHGLIHDLLAYGVDPSFHLRNP